MTNKNILQILVINTFVLIFFNFAHPVTPEMLISKNMPDSVNGLMYSFMSLGMVIGSPYFGKKLKSIKISKIMVISLIGYAISQQLFCYGQTFLVMGIGRIVSGFMAGGWIVASLYYVNKNSNDENKARNLAYLMVSNSLASIVGQIISGYLGTNIHYTYIFVLQFIGLISISLFCRLFDEGISKVSEKASDILDETAKIKQNFSIKTIVFPLFLMLLFSLAYTAINSQIGYYAQDVLHKDTLFIGVLNSYINIISLIVNLFVIDKLYKKLKFPNIFILKSLVSILGVLLYLNITGSSLLFLTLIILGLVSYRPVLQKIIIDMSSENSSIALGYLNSASSIGMVLGGGLIGVVYQLNKIYVIYILLLLLIIILISSVIYKFKGNING